MLSHRPGIAGNNTAYCPGPLLSVFVNNCMERGLDYYSGGAKYNIYGPCYTTLSATINSLYNIKKMVFDKSDAVTTLPELFECLACDWGYKMIEPFTSHLASFNQCNKGICIIAFVSHDSVWRKAFYQSFRLFDFRILLWS
ncbi:MAG: pyruvate formate lyase family protein [Pseudomonadota bacterium]